MCEFKSKKKNKRKIYIIGKGVSFDTGGLNLKLGNGMSLMKKDMGGAANAIGLGKILSTLDIDQVEEQILAKDSKNLKIDKVLFEKKDKINLSSELKQLGREEGKVLRSHWLKFAITKWCNIEIRKNKLSELKENEISTIILAFENSLRETIEIAVRDELEKKIS